MRIALVQMACPWGDVKRTLRRSAPYIREGGRSGADLVLFPEMSVHGMWKDHLVRLAAEPLDGPIVRQMGRWARQSRVAVGFGLAERTGGKPFNTFVVLDREGRLGGVHRKNYITPLERDYFRGDRRRPVFRLGALRVAVGICADNCQTELLASYGRRGADLVLMPHAWDADPILKGGRVAAWRDMADMAANYARGRVVRHRTHDEMLRQFVDRLGPMCREHRFVAAFVNQVGLPHPLMPFVGPSFVLDRSGALVARSRGKREGILLADVPSLAL